MDDNTLDKLLAAARDSRPDTGRLEFGFETRLQARLRSEAEVGWFDLNWRLAPLFALIAVAVAYFASQTESDWETPLFITQAAQAVVSADELAGETL